MGKMRRNGSRMGEKEKKSERQELAPRAIRVPHLSDEGHRVSNR